MSLVHTYKADELTLEWNCDECRCDGADENDPGHDPEKFLDTWMCDVNRDSQGLHTHEHLLCRRCEKKYKDDPFHGVPGEKFVPGYPWRPCLTCWRCHTHKNVVPVEVYRAASYQVGVYWCLRCTRSNWPEGVVHVRVHKDSK